MHARRLISDDDTRVTTCVLTVLRALRGVTVIFLTNSIRHDSSLNDQRVVRIRRAAAGRRCPHALPKKTRFGEGLEQYPAHLVIETRQPRRVSRGESGAGHINEQVLDTCERLFEAPGLGALRHVRLSLAALRRPRFSGTGPFGVDCRDCSRHRIRPSSPASCRALVKADA